MSVPAPHDEPVTAHVHVVRGAPDEVELAALVAGLVASSSATHDEHVAAPSAWADHRRTLPRRPAPAPGPDAWRWSLHP